MLWPLHLDVLQELSNVMDLLNCVFHASRSSFVSDDNRCLLLVPSCFSSNISVFRRAQMSLGATATRPTQCAKSKVPIGVCKEEREIR